MENLTKHVNQWNKGIYAQMHKIFVDALFMMYYFSQTSMCSQENFMESAPLSLVCFCGPLWWLCPCFWTCIFCLLTFASYIARLICSLRSFKCLYFKTKSCNVRSCTYKAHPICFWGPFIPTMYCVRKIKSINVTNYGEGDKIDCT